jgi:hypothetical protein
MVAARVSLSLAVCAQAVSGVVYDPSRCIKGNPRFIEWVEDYKLETDEVEARCNLDVKSLHDNLIGAHGPPLEIEMKSVVCFGACQQYISNIDYLLETSGCPCEMMDEVFSLSEIDHEFESWCQRRPTEFLAQHTGIISDWRAFNARYCECSTAIACESVSRRSSHASYFLLAFVVAGASALLSV